MKAALVLLIASVLACRSAAGAERVVGAVCDKSQALEEMRWDFPRIDSTCAACAETINAALAKHVMALLNREAFEHSGTCKDLFPDEDVEYRYSMYCEVTFQTSRLVSLQCSSEGSSPGGSATNYTSVLFTMDGEHASRIRSEEMFTAEGRRKLLGALSRIIRDQHRQAREQDPNGQIEEEDIPSLANEMLTTATFQPDGLYFLALGHHHSVFDTTLAIDALRRWFAPFMATVLRDVSNTVAVQ
jgi:hypothetical protein